MASAVRRGDPGARPKTRAFVTERTWADQTKPAFSDAATIPHASHAGGFACEYGIIGRLDKYSSIWLNIDMSTLDLAFAALSDPTRRRIVQRLSRGRTRVTDLALPFDMSLNAVSKHIKVLERSGLVRREKLGREHYLELRAKPMRDVARWISRYERFWNQKLDSLGQFLANQPDEEQQP